MLNATCDNQANDTSLCIDENLSVTPFQGLIIEHIGTLILTMTVLSITDSRSEQYWSPSLMIGLTVVLCHLLMIPYTGCSVVSTISKISLKSKFHEFFFVESREIFWPCFDYQQL